jgi:hypothetical protein
MIGSTTVSKDLKFIAMGFGRCGREVRLPADAVQRRWRSEWQLRGKTGHCRAGGTVANSETTAGPRWELSRTEAASRVSLIYDSRTGASAPLLPVEARAIGRGFSGSHESAQ